MKKTLFFLGILFSGILCSQDKVIDSLQALLKVAPKDTSKVNLLNQLSNRYTDATNYDQAVSSAQQALDLSSKLPFRPGMARSNVMLGRAFWKKGNIDAGLPYYFKAEKLYADMADKPGLAKTDAAIGLIYAYHDRFPQSLQYLYKALRMYEVLGDSEGIAKIHLNLGFSYLGQQNGPKAKKYLLLASKELKKAGNIGGQATALINLGNLYLGRVPKSLPDSAMFMYQQGLKLASAIGDIKNQGIALVNMGIIYRDWGDTTKALETFFKSMEIHKKLNDKGGVAAVLMDIGIIYKLQYKNKKAIVYFEDAAALAKEVNSWEYTFYSQNHLSELYARQHDYKKAFAAHVLRSNAYDSLFNEKNTKKIVQAEMDFNFEKKELAFKAEAEKREAVYKEENRRQKTIIIAAIAVLGLMICITFLIIRQIKFRNEQREIQLEHQLLRTQMNPHFIFNSLQAIQNYILTNKTMDAAKYLSSFARITRSVLEGSRMELISVEKEVELLNNYLQLQKLRFGDRFDYRIDVQPGLDTNMLIPPMLSQPFIENALEHGMRDIESGGLILVNMAVKEDRLVLEIKDNGQGLSQTPEPKRIHQSLATAITRERIKLMNRKQSAKIIFTIEDAYPDQVHKGVKVSFSIPI